MNKPTVMSILALAPCKPGSFEEYTIHLSEALNRHGQNSILVFVDSPPDWLKERFYNSGAQLEVLDMGASVLRQAFSLYKILKKYNPQIVHVHFTGFLSPTMYAVCLLSNSTILYSEHCNKWVFPPPTSLKSNLIYPIKRVITYLLLKKVKRIITPSNFVRNEIVNSNNINPEKIYTIYNGVNMARFDANRQPSIPIRPFLNIPDGSPIVTTVAHAVPQKGLDCFLKAIPEVLRVFPRVHFVHVGDGPKLEEYKRLAEELQISNYITFTGLVKEKDLLDSIFLETNAFVLCSRWGETFSLVILEAMAFGKPVIASKTWGIPEAVDDDVTGLLFLTDDSTALANAIIRLLKDPQLAQRMGQAGRKRAEEYFDIKMMVDKTIALYEECLSTQPVKAMK